MGCVVRNGVTIHRPIEEVFAFVTNPTTRPQWQPNVVDFAMLTPGSMRVGTCIKEIRQQKNVKRHALWEITLYEPPIKYNYVYREASGPFQQSGSLLFTPISNGTLLQSTISVSATFPFTLLLPLFMHRLSRLNQQDYTRLKAVLEARNT